MSFSKLTDDEKGQIVKIVTQIVLDIIIMGGLVYAIHFIFAWPSVWLTAIILFSVLLRTGWWEVLEKRLKRWD